MIQVQKEDATPFISGLIKQVIIAKMFSIIDEKKQYQSKRRTWNRIRKEEKIKEALEIRKKWNYPEPVINVKNKLDKIFENYEES